MSEGHDRELGAVKQQSLEEILKGIHLELLDQPCQDKRLCEVATHVTNWLSLAPFLGITEAQEKEILENWPRNTAKQKIDFLRKWQEKHGQKATYRRLCKAVLKAGEVSLAEKVYNIVTSEDSSGSESGEDESCTVAASASSLAVNQQPRPEEMESDPVSLHTDTHTHTGTDGLDNESERTSSKPLRPIPRPRTKKAVQGSGSPPSLPPKPKPRSVKVVGQHYLSSIHSSPPPRDSQSSQDGRSPPLYHTDPPMPTTSEPDPLDSYINYLRDMYDLTLCPQFLALQWPPSPTRKVFNLAMIKSRDTQHGPVDEELVRLLQRGNVAQYTSDRVAVQLKDLLTLDEKKRKVILIEGAPGSGKSTLAWHACQQWKAGELFQELKMVVFVQLRDPRVQLAKSIADLLPAGSEKRRRDAAEGIEASEGRGVLFVLDGWDEYGPGLDTDYIVSKLICNPDELEMPYISLIITSRPIVSAVLQQRASSRVEIVGFTPEEVDQYFQEVVQDPAAVKSLQEQLKTLPVIEASCYLPLNAAIVAHLFLGLNNTLPKTLFEVFSALVCGCIIRYLTKKSGKEGHIPEIRSLDKLPHNVQVPFENVCVLAYEASRKNKATFSSEDLSVSLEGNGLGLMQGVQSFLSGKSDSYHFLHLSVQELLAAVHVSKLGAVDQVSVFRDIFSEPRLVAVFRFFAALTKLENEGIREVVAGVIVGNKPIHIRSDEWDESNEGKHWRHGVLNILHCLYEAQDMSLCLFVASLFGDDWKGLDLSILSLSPFDCLCVGYFLRCVCVGRKGEFRVTLAFCGIDSYSIGFLVKELGKCSGVDVSSGSSNAVIMGCLALNLSRNYIDESGVHQLCKLMNNPSVIKRLDLSWNPGNIGREDGLFCLLRVLCSNHSLVVLRLLWCIQRIDGETGPVFVEMLQKNNSLKVLELSGHVGDIGVGYIAEGMTGNSGVVVLALKSCNIGPKGGKALGRMLTNNRTLKYLDLSHNGKLRDAGLMEVSKGMKVNCRLNWLNICGCGYGLDSLKEFVLSLKENGHLRGLGVKREERTKSRILEALDIGVNQDLDEVELLVEERAAVNDLRRRRREVELEVVNGDQMVRKVFVRRLSTIA